MITLDAFDVRPAGAISRHAAASAAAHQRIAAAGAAAHQRIAAAKTQRPWIGPLPT